MAWQEVARVWAGGVLFSYDLTTDQGGPNGNGSLNVQAGDLLVAFFGCDDGDATPAWTFTGTINNTNFQTNGKVHNGPSGGVSGQMWWTLNAVAATAEFYNWQVADQNQRGYIGFVVFQFRDSQSVVAELDDEDNTGVGNGSGIQSGGLVTTGSNVVVVAAAKHYDSPGTSNHGYNGSNNADGVEDFNNFGYAAAWYKFDDTNSFAQADGGGGNWICPAAAFRADGAPPVGWTGKIIGVTNPSKINGIDVSNIAKVNTS